MRWFWVPFLVDYHFECVLPMWFQVHLSIEQECRYPIPLECILDNLTTITYFRWSLLQIYTFES
jgi:hypothetical protein